MERPYSYRCSCGYRFRVAKAELGHEHACPQCGERRRISRHMVRRVPRPRNEDRSQATTSVFEWRRGQILFDVYEVRQLLGQGGMGRVYKVYHPGWDSLFAVKVPKPNLLRNVVAATNFERECQTWVKLGLHPNIVSCYFVRRLEEVPLIFSEYVSAGSLHDWIRNGRLYRGGGKRAIARMLDVLIQFAWGLHYAHEQGLVHQDVKPANVLIGPDRTVKVSDFGLARAMEQIQGRTRTEKAADPLVTSGSYTPAYCSPEQAEGERLSRATDIWSWGVSAIEVFAGDVTWMTGQAAPHVLEDLAGRTKSPSEKFDIPRMPKSFVKVLQKCFHEDPRRRPKNLLEVAERLKDIYLEATGRFYERAEPSMAAVEGSELQVGSLNNHAVSLVELGETDEANRTIKKAELTAKAFETVEADPKVQDIAYNYCLLQIRTNPVFDPANAPDLIPFAPDHFKHAYYAGTLLLEGGDVHAAIDFLTAAIEEDNPYRRDALSVRAIALLLSGETQPAILSLKEALRKGPRRLDLVRNLALAYFYDGKPARALRLYEEIAASRVLDSNDAIRYATILSAAGFRKDAQAYARQALAANRVAPFVRITAAELLAGHQTFLPNVGRTIVDGYEPETLLHGALADDPDNLRAQVDLESRLESSRIRPAAKVRRGAFRPPEESSAQTLGRYLMASYRPVTRAARWGEPQSGKSGHRVTLLSLLLPMAAGYFLWSRLTAPERLQDAFIYQATWLPSALWFALLAVLAALALRRLPQRRLAGPLTVSCIALPFFVYLPTALHHWFWEAVADIASVSLANQFDFLWLLGGCLLLVVGLQQYINQRLTARVRALGSARLWRGLRRRATPGEWTQATDVKPVLEGVSSTRSGPVERRSAGEILFGWIRATNSRIHYAIDRMISAGYANAGIWMLFLLPEFLLLAIADSAWVLGHDRGRFLPYFIVILFGHLVLLVYGLVLPRVLVLMNWALLFLVAAALTGEMFPSWSALGWVFFIGVSLALGGLNWLAMRTCPAFAHRHDRYRHAQWDVQSLVDPLHIRQYSAPWRLIRLEADRRNQ